MTPPWTHTRLGWWLIGILAAVQLAALPGDYLGMEHDDAHYVLAARALLRGEYRLGISPGDPPLTFITPGWPLLLAPAAALSGDSPWGYHLTAWGFLAACDALVWLWLRRVLQPRGAALGTLLFGLCPLVLGRAGKVMSEIPALALTLALLLGLDRPRWPAWAAGAGLGFAWLIRSPSLALIPAVSGFYAFGKRRLRASESLTCAAVAALPILAWSAWTISMGSPPDDWRDLGTAYGAPGDVARVLRENARFYASLWGGLWLPFPPDGGGLQAALGTVLAGLCAYGGIRLWRRRGYDPALAWLGLGALMHAFWPWRYERYLLPFLPMLIWTLLEAINALRPGLAAPALSLALAGQSLGQSRHILSGRAARTQPELRMTYAWLRANTPAHRAVASLLYSRDALYLGRPAAPLPAPEPSRELARALSRRGVGHVLLHAVDPGTSLGPGFAALRDLASLRDSLRRPPFRRVYRNDDEGAEVYAVPGP